MPQFVLLYHDCPNDKPRESHCDLMLEKDGALRTWAIAELPFAFRVARPGAPSDGRGLRFAPTNTVPAEQLPDHRLAYLELEGEVSGNRGTVTRLDSGEFVTQQESPNLWAIELAGHAIRGHITLQCVSLHEPAWQLKFEAASPIRAD